MVTMMQKVQMKLLAMSQKWRMLARNNIADVDACMTRLRITVHNPDLVGDEASWKQAGAMGFIVKGSGIQAIYGPKADVLKSDIQDVLSSGVEIPKM